MADRKDRDQGQRIEERVGRLSHGSREEPHGSYRDLDRPGGGRSVERPDRKTVPDGGILDAEMDKDAPGGESPGGRS